MKFVCMKCETYMNFEKVEKPAEGSLGVFFACPSCGARFTMVTNPGETQMVSSLGVQLGGRSAAPQPFEMTRGGLRGEGEGQAEMANYLKEHYSEKRLENIPDFIRPMARREIERIAMERGAAQVTEAIMDETKTKFMNFM